MKNLIVVFAISSACAFGDDAPISDQTDAPSDASACAGVCPKVAMMASEDASRCVSLCAEQPDLTNEDQMTRIMLDAFSK